MMLDRRRWRLPDAWMQRSRSLVFQVVWIPCGQARPVRRACRALKIRQAPGAVSGHRHGMDGLGGTAEKIVRGSGAGYESPGRQATCRVAHQETGGPGCQAPMVKSGESPTSGGRFGSSSTLFHRQNIQVHCKRHSPCFRILFIHVQRSMVLDSLNPLACQR